MRVGMLIRSVWVGHASDVQPVSKARLPYGRDVGGRDDRWTSARGHDEDGVNRVGEQLARRALERVLALPRVTLRRMLGPAPVNDDGMELDLQIQALLALHRRLPVGPRADDPARRRIQME